MMNAEFVKELRASFAQPQVLDGRTIVPAGWSESTPKQYAPEPLAMNTLGALRDYIASGLDTLPKDVTALHVQSPTLVGLDGNLEPEAQRFRRKRFAFATVPADPFAFGKYLDAESFNIALQTQFVSTPAREELIALVASIRENAVTETVDDGVAQEVKTAAGVLLSNRTKIPNPVTLKPFRTFREVEQPASLFVLRLRASGGGQKPECALFEADGGAWRLEAIASVAKWLREAVPGTTVFA